MERLTALKARELAGPTIQEKIDMILCAIEIAAKEKKKRELKTGWDYRFDRDLWIDGGYNNTQSWQDAKSILESLGYKVSFVYKETQFVDMYTLIEW